MTKTQDTTKTAVKYNSSGAAAGFGPTSNPPKDDPSAASKIVNKVDHRYSYNADNRAFIAKLKRS